MRAGECLGLMWDDVDFENRKIHIHHTLAMGAEFKHPEMVFTSDTGDYKDRSSLYGSFKNRLKGTEFEFMTLHMLRHSNATLLLNSGMDLKVISEHLGHANIKVTADVYTVVLDDTCRKTADKIEEILAEKTPNKHQNQKSG